LERRLAAILAADVEGYSRLMHCDEEATMATLSARRAIVDGLIEEYRGRIANTAGDSVLAEFVSVRDAVFCALDIQAALAAANEQDPEERRMRFRIGVNVGDVMVKDGDLFGDGVNVAARLEGLIEGGGICVSRGVRDHLRHHTTLAFDDLGEQLVKNIAHPVRAFRVRTGGPSSQYDGDHQSTSPPPESMLSDDDPVTTHDDVALELALWDSVKDGDTGELDTYIEQYPDGTFAPLARKRQDSEAAAQTPAEAVPSEALDLAFWETVKDSNSPDELQAYLDSHPEGHFAALARARLATAASPHELTAEESVSSTAVELAFWEAVQAANDPNLFAAYLEKYPDGEFALLAQARVTSASPDAGPGGRHRTH
jgi:class 3 adenylate cyclase